MYVCVCVCVCVCVYVYMYVLCAKKLRISFFLSHSHVVCVGTCVCYVVCVLDPEQLEQMKGMSLQNMMQAPPSPPAKRRRRIESTEQ